MASSVAPSPSADDDGTGHPHRAVLDAKVMVGAGIYEGMRKAGAGILNARSEGVVRATSRARSDGVIVSDPIPLDGSPGVDRNACGHEASAPIPDSHVHKGRAAAIDDRQARGWRWIAAPAEHRCCETHGTRDDATGKRHTHLRQVGTIGERLAYRKLDVGRNYEPLGPRQTWGIRLRCGMRWWSLASGAAAAAFALATLPGKAAYGQSPSDGDKVAAEALFEDGRRLAEAGKYPEACPKFADSQRLDASAATLLNLANCLEKVGRTATAWATFKQAGSLASATGRSDYVATADRRAQALFAKLARLIVNVPHATVAMVVKRDNAVLEHSEWGSPIPIDAGPHLLIATAPGYVPWTSTVDIAQDGIEVSVVVPQLEALAGSVSSTAPPLSAESSSTETQNLAVDSNPHQAEAPRHSLGGRRVLGLVVGSAGLVSLGMGAVFGAVAVSKYHASLGACEWDNTNACEPQMVTQVAAERSDARTAANVATWTLGAGAAGLIGGAVIWFTAPAPTNERRSPGAGWVVAPTLGGAVVRGAW